MVKFHHAHHPPGDFVVRALGAVDNREHIGVAVRVLAEQEGTVIAALQQRCNSKEAHNKVGMKEVSSA